MAEKVTKKHEIPIPIGSQPTYFFSLLWPFANRYVHIVSKTCVAAVLGSIKPGMSGFLNPYTSVSHTKAWRFCWFLDNKSNSWKKIEGEMLLRV